MDLFIHPSTRPYYLFLLWLDHQAPGQMPETPRLRIQGSHSAGRGMFPTEDACNGLLPVTTVFSRTVPCRGLLHFRHDTCAVTLQCGHNRKAPIDGHRRRQASSDTDKGQGRKVRMPQLRHHDIFPFYPSCPFIIGTLRLPHTQTTASSNIRLAE